MKIGVLALQGAFIEHIHLIQKLGYEGYEIRKRADFTDDFDGLILPGGESTVMGKLLVELGLLEPIRQSIHNGLPVFGTCAGLILLAKEIDEDETTHFSVMDACVRRNAYGRQLGSFAVKASFASLGEIPMVFIRAPSIAWVGNNVETLAVVDEKIVAARQDNILATTFHPELTESLLVHEYFFSMIADSSPLPDKFLKKTKAHSFLL